MKPAPFVHHAPRTVDETVAVLAEVGHDGKVLAGGQSLIPVLNMRLASPGHLVDINGVAGLDAVDVTDAWVRVGALVRHAGLERDDAADAALPLLRQALRNVAHPAIRNRGTTVGSIAHADPAGEMPSVLLLTGGVVEAVGARGRREIAAADFFEGPLETTLAPRRARRGGAVRPPRARHPHRVPGVRPPPRRLRDRRGGRRPGGRRRGGALGPRVVRLGHPRAHRARPHARARRLGCRSAAAALGRRRGRRARARPRRPRGRHPRERRLPPDAGRRADPAGGHRGPGRPTHVEGAA